MRLCVWAKDPKPGNAQDVASIHLICDGFEERCHSNNRLPLIRILFSRHTVYAAGERCCVFQLREIGNLNVAARRLLFGRSILLRIIRWFCREADSNIPENALISLVSYWPSRCSLAIKTCVACSMVEALIICTSLSTSSKIGESNLASYGAAFGRRRSHRQPNRFE